jgi:hypothetical protein
LTEYYYRVGEKVINDGNSELSLSIVV